MSRFACILLIIFCSCNNTEEKQHSSNINELYNKINKNRYAQNDSLSYFISQMEEKSEGLAPEYVAMGEISKGIYYSKRAAYDSALVWFKKSLNTLKDSKADSLIGKAYNGVGNCYKNTGNYAEAVSFHQKALAIFTTIAYKEGIAGVHSNLGQTYQLKEDYNTAKFHLKQAITVLKERKTSNAYLNAVHTLANIYAHTNYLDSALLLDDEGIRLAKETGSSLFLSPFYDNKAKCLAELGRYDSAHYYFSASFTIDSISGSKKQMSDSYLNMGALSIKTKNWADAEQKLARSMELAEQAGYNLGKQSAWKALADLYTAQSKNDRALEAQKRFAAIKDSLLNEKTELRIAELRTQYETGEKEHQIAIQQASLQQQRILIVAVVLFFSLLLYTVYNYYKKNQQKRQAEFDARIHKQQEEATIRILTAEEKERQRIASDLHDGIGQTMTAAWLNLQAINNRFNLGIEETNLVKKTTELVGESCLELRQVSHNMMPNALTRKGLINALRDFTGQLDEQILSVSFQAEESTLSLNETTSIILYRVVQECINNVIKHARATELDISISKDEEGLSIMIEDNGIGIDKAALSSGKGLGVQNIQSRIDYLKGTVEWDNTGNGTVVAIHIPIS